MALPLAFSFNSLVDAFAVFFDRVTDVKWQFLGLALCCHLFKIVVASRGWRNVVAAAYCDRGVRWRSMLGAYLAAAGVNALAPARGGDVVRVALAKRRIEGSTYTTLAATLVVGSVFDASVAIALFIWALTLGALPGHQLLSHRAVFDFSWFFAHPSETLYILLFTTLLLIAGVLWLLPSLRQIRERLLLGIEALRRPRYYFLHVVPWQVLDWSGRLGTIYFALGAFGLPATLRNVLLAQTAASLATLFPVSPAGMGTDQALLVYVYHGVASSASILSYSVGIKLMTITANATLGFTAIALMMRTVRFREVVRSERAAVSGRGAAAAAEAPEGSRVQR
ncbi:MAG: lysylphosphatidylglycerol synthase transmembrane domain-containing protein [Gaiellaceae bacterium]